jgi:hypothetical protein
MDICYLDMNIMLHISFNGSFLFKFSKNSILEGWYPVMSEKVDWTFLCRIMWVKLLYCIHNLMQFIAILFFLYLMSIFFLFIHLVTKFMPIPLHLNINHFWNAKQNLRFWKQTILVPFRQFASDEFSAAGKLVLISNLLCNHHQKLINAWDYIR